MNVTIIGTGNMGRGIATRLLAGGNRVSLIGHQTDDAESLAAELQGAASGGGQVSAVPTGRTIPDEIVILAVWFHAHQEIVNQYGDQLAGKILVDISNPLNATYDALATEPGTSAAENLARIAPSGARVLKAFNTTFAGTLMSGQVAGQPLDVFIAGDDAGAKTTLSRLVESGGLRPIDTGPLLRARQLENLGLLHITLQSTLGSNWGSAVKILP